MSGLMINPYAFGAGVTDPHWANVEVLIGFNVANGSSSFVDEGPDGRTVTTNGAVVATTTSPLVGSASASFPGADTAYLSLAHDTLLSLGGGDRTYEARINLSNLSATRYLFNKRPSSGLTREFAFSVTTAGALRMFAYNTAGTLVAIDISSATGLISTGTTYEVALSRTHSTGTSYLAINGEVVASGVETSALSTANEPLLIGRDPTGGGRHFAGKMDEVRITSAARFTGDYSATAGAYPRS